MWLNVFNEWKLQRNEVRRFEKSRQQLEAKARELRVKGYGKRKNASHALNEEDEESSGSQVSSVNILLKPWSM